MALLTTLCKKYKLKHFSKQALERLIEYASRISQDKEKLTTRLSLISDLMKEADYFARKEKEKIINKNHIEEAISAKISRSDNLHKRMLEHIQNNTILINTAGYQVGQINILAVQEFGHLSFGRPSRLTCQTRVGSGEIIDIEREVDLGGPFHSKGVLILSSFVASKFAKDEPLSLNANLVIEQSYGPIDGDSASSAELYALLSSISGVPINQGIAVTGSVNQLGQVQAIGAVNEKIEGFFDVCSIKGLTGSQGVIIPSSNKRNLMLRADVIKAVQEGLFHIYAVDNIEQGLEILTNTSVGIPNSKGKYPSDTIYGRIQEQLHAYYLKTKDSEHTKKRKASYE